ncbi:hypothetical protein CIAM_24950 [Citrobacter amalonaticus]|nr:hypothetical protein CIAM_24950 [Citrobacter amalonaticus]
MWKGGNTANLQELTEISDWGEQGGQRTGNQKYDRGKVFRTAGSIFTQHLVVSVNGVLHVQKASQNQNRYDIRPGYRPR